MTATGTINIAGTISGYPSGTTTINMSIIIPSAVDDVITLLLDPGYNEITVPVGATMVMISPPYTNTLSLQLKGNTSDTGLSIHKTNPTILSLDGASVIGIVAAAPGVGYTEFRFF